MPKRGRRITKAREEASKDPMKPIDAFSSLLKQSKAFESVDVVFVLGIDGRKSDQVVRGVVDDMPAGLGKKISIGVFSKADASASLNAGAAHVGMEDLFEKVKSQEVDCDVYLATSDIMPQLAKMGLGRLLKGKMPNPKLGTVVEADKLLDAIKGQLAGKFTFRSNGFLVHGSIGRVSFDPQDLVKNYEAIFATIWKSRPSAIKEHSYVKRVFCSSTMGPSFQIDTSESIKSMKG